ncbi:MAG: hypothetical protein AAGF56_08260 [Pseudomonadota bacterium]
MFIELIATIFAGFAFAGLALAVNLLSGRRLPRWIVPIAAGAGMIAVTISNEYTWYGRTAASLPDNMRVAMTVEEQSWLRPWTQIWPYSKRFVAVDQASTRQNQNLPDLRLVDLYFFGRWSPVNRAPMLFDCAANRSALLIDGAEFAADGTIANADWQAVASDDPVLTSACEV